MGKLRAIAPPQLREKSEERKVEESAYADRILRRVAGFRLAPLLHSLPTKIKKGHSRANHQVSLQGTEVRLSK